MEVNKHTRNSIGFRKYTVGINYQDHPGYGQTQENGDCKNTKVLQAIKFRKIQLGKGLNTDKESMKDLKHHKISSLHLR